MNEKLKVKIIKKGVISASPVTRIDQERSKRAAARQMVSNVSTWVSELQSRKKDEAKKAFNNLFAQTPTPSET